MKNSVRGIVAAVIILAIYNVIAFIIPFGHAAAFWISYGFTMAAFVVAFASIYIAFVKNPDARSRFYGFPIARIGAVYSILQALLSLIVMALAQWIPWWIATVVYSIGFGFAVIGLISVQTVVDEIRLQDHKLKKDVSVMRTLQSKVNQLASQSEDSQIRALAEEFRYSDPVSSDAIAEAEADLVAVVDQLQEAFVDGDSASVAQLCRKATGLLAERNRLCKLNKSS